MYFLSRKKKGQKRQFWVGWPKGWPSLGQWWPRHPWLRPCSVNVAYLKMTWGLRFHLFFFLSFLGAGLLMSFQGRSCPSIMIICIQPQTWGVRGRGCGNGASGFFFFLSNWDGAPPGVGALRKRHTLRIGSSGTVRIFIYYINYFCNNTKYKWH